MKLTCFEENIINDSNGSESTPNKKEEENPNPCLPNKAIRVQIHWRKKAHRFQRSRWDLAGRERQRRSISTQRDWMWVMSLVIEDESSGGDSIPALEYSRRSRRSTASLVLNTTFFAFWYISDSVLLPPPPPSISALISFLFSLTQ
jgi:hypothetical protein